MTRLTRAEQQRRTHEHLLEAGRQVFLRRGFLAATVEEIAADAGYTRGAVYKHFGGKEGLWLAIIEATAEGHLERLRRTLALATGRDDVIAALAPVDVVDKDAAQWSAAAAEVLAATAQQPETAALVAAVQRRHDDEVVSLLAEHARRLRLEPALPLRDAVVMLGALGIGLALRQAVAPAADPAAILTHVLDSVFPPEVT
ncbi:DNA-binding transcriptional regulator, AcrR family [Amycolatopsis lurida]|uniref:TetR family transcriptional regulator n=1 Tax=Amycolatopsis lurida NRRL 2430 TaxID=1460371 RepID=A0A2P2FKY3_AMYLU|nr:TetR/AcrR family transcriptional regulator [Amycolatopsis lurida]KFU77381.1 TetR family transcriptional regulator [Amycolatopsis lurida NRRL 2430]SEB37287.1 DNA-binding transcriptional regulator, AcrR family [Amycolatopsis lurida]